MSSRSLDVARALLRWCLCAALVLPLAAQELRPGSGWLKPGGKWEFKMPIRVLLGGDSLMESLGPQMRQCLQGYENMTLIPIGKKSTGLSRPDFYNWPKVLKERLTADKPQLVVFWVGTNDPQGIYGMRGLGEPCSRAWLLAYLGKIRELFRLVRQHRARLILMGPPTVAEAKLDAQLEQINRLMAWACQNWDQKYGGVCYVDTRAILSDRRGRFLRVGEVPGGQNAVLRTPDGVHITAEGNRRVMNHLLPYMARELRRCFQADGASPAEPAGGRGAGISGKSRATRSR